MIGYSIEVEKGRCRWDNPDSALVHPIAYSLWSLSYIDHDDEVQHSLTFYSPGLSSFRNWGNFSPSPLPPIC